jgi:hypothetical protein
MGAARRERFGDCCANDARSDNKNSHS